jgi:hypothetical protein
MMIPARFSLKLKLGKELGYKILKSPNIYVVYEIQILKSQELGSWNYGNSWVWSLTWRKRICK